jgi:hypothetical protein
MSGEIYKPFILISLFFTCSQGKLTWEDKPRALLTPKSPGRRFVAFGWVQKAVFRVFLGIKSEFQEKKTKESCRTHENSIFHPKKGWKAWMTSCARFALVKVVMQVVVHK